METIQWYMYMMRVHDEGTVAAKIKVTFRFTIALRYGFQVGLVRTCSYKLTQNLSIARPSSDVTV